MWDDQKYLQLAGQQKIRYYMQIHIDLRPMVIFPHYTHSCSADSIIAVNIKPELSGDNLSQAGTTFSSIVGHIVGPNNCISSGEQLV